VKILVTGINGAVGGNLFRLFGKDGSFILDGMSRQPYHLLELSPDINSSRFQLDQAALETQIKKQVQNQFDQLIGLILSNKGAGTSTATFLIRKFIRTIRRLRSKILEIIAEEMIRALGCDSEQTYAAGQYYIKISSIDCLLTGSSSIVRSLNFSLFRIVLSGINILYLLCLIDELWLRSQ
jgi:hypothetical protein